MPPVIGLCFAGMMPPTPENRVNPLSGKSSNARYSQSRTDTRIGTGVRVAGNVTFTGVLLVEGGVLGDLSCEADTKGTLVVGPSGHVSGAIKAPHIVVSGRVSGPSDSSESIEIQSGACLAGDMSYKAIEVHAGGVIEGLLTPRLAAAMDQLEHGRPVQVSDSRPVNERGMQLPDQVQARTRLGDVAWGGRALGWTAILLITVAAALWWNLYVTPIAPPRADVALKSSSAINEPLTAQAVPAEGGGPQEVTKGAGVADVPLVPNSDTATTGVVQASAAGLAGIDSDQVVTVHGVNPRKPAGLFSVTSKEPSVLFRKKRQDPSDGTRIDVLEGATKTIPIGKDEIFRVAAGRNLMIFYQGRMVPPRTVESGAWMSFVPQSPGGANDND
ncbi:MAG: polymer-forming cytoskeletal family protein [Rhodocyclaceae bacterium]|nr:MAG: polymer-forming cytoskeletal family protein [Rhodocyclaceae bacterium]